MKTECNVKKLCNTCSQTMNKAKNTMDMLKSMTINNKADIDFSIESTKSDCPIFSFKKKFDKQYRLLPIIGVALGILLIITLLKCDSDN